MTKINISNNENVKLDFINNIENELINELKCRGRGVYYFNNTLVGKGAMEIIKEKFTNNGFHVNITHDGGTKTNDVVIKKFFGLCKKATQITTEYSILRYKMEIFIKFN